MKLPQGRLVRKRVVSSLDATLERVLDDELTGYARLESQDELLLGADGAGVLTFEDGIPMVAYHTGTDAGGPAALTDIAVAGPYRLELFELDAADLAAVHKTEPLSVPPGMPAKQLVGDPALAERTEQRAPAATIETEETADSPTDAVEAFLDDEETIATLKNRARTEARSRADEWGFDIPDE